MKLTARTSPRRFIYSPILPQHIVSRNILTPIYGIGILTWKNYPNIMSVGRKNQNAKSVYLNGGRSFFLPPDKVR